MNRMPLSLHSIAVASRRRTLLSRVPKAPRVRTNGGMALHGLFTQRFRLRLPRPQRRQFTDSRMPWLLAVWRGEALAARSWRR